MADDLRTTQTLACVEYVPVWERRATQALVMVEHEPDPVERQVAQVLLMVEYIDSKPIIKKDPPPPVRMLWVIAPDGQRAAFGMGRR